MSGGVSCLLFAEFLRVAEECIGPKLMGSVEGVNRLIALPAEAETIVRGWPTDPTPRPEPERDEEG